MSIGSLSLEIRDKSSSFLNFITGEAEGIVLSTTSPGGCFECRFRLKRRARLQYFDIGYPYEVWVSDNVGVFWRGRMERVRRVFHDFQEYIEIIALGGGVNTDDQVIVGDTTSATAGTAVETIVGTLISTYVPKVPNTSLVVTGRNLTASITIDGKRTRQAINDIIRLGTSANAPLLWHVWPDGSNNAYVFELVARPTTAGYTVDLNNVDLSFGFDGSAYANRVRISYTLAGVKTWRMVEDSAAQTLVNLIRETAIEAPEFVNATDADNAANTVLTQTKKLIAVAEDGSITSPFAILDSNAQVVPLHRVRAGKLLVIQGPESGAGTLGTIDWGNSVLIVRTEYNNDSGTLTLTFESFKTTLEGLIASVLTRTEI